MSADNNLQIVGNLGGDPELKSWPNNPDQQFAAFSIAHNRYAGRDDQGKPKYKTTWLEIEVRNPKGAEYVFNYIKTGEKVLINGELVVDEFQGRDGTPKKKIKVVVNEMRGVVSLGKSNASDGSQTSAQDYQLASGGGVAQTAQTASQGFTGPANGYPAQTQPAAAMIDPDEIGF